eukprot:TRINITY_DN1571_c1_g1_i1.p1 TRINITY_DN1571_c1_g1~~TRINITY_DN1571_c1_g1_i1.p1  ORF type:complete len:288 (-),score=25.87 TRINITY_DN1571_c1_g1_i1:317-1114(-)
MLTCNVPTNPKFFRTSYVCLVAHDISKRNCFGRKKVIRTTGEYGQDGAGSVEGDKRLQEALATVMQIEVTKAKAKEELNTAVEGERGRLIEAAEQAKEEIDRIASTSDQRSESAFNAALENVNQNFEEYFKELQNSRRQMEEDEADFEEFQKQMVEDRSKGQFFKQLYQQDLPVKKDDPKRAASRKERQQLRKKLYRQTYDTSKSPLRLGIYSLLTLILSTNVVIDLVSDSASYGADVFYTMLTIIFGAYAWKERSYIIKARQTK